MKIVDANVLLYAVNASSPEHRVSRAWLDRALGGRESIGLPWVVLLAFLRLSTRRGLFPHPLTVEQALAVVEGWLGAPAAVVPEPSARHAPLLGGLLRAAGTGGNLVTDAHLATLAVEHAATIVSWDRDFERFAGLGVERPVG